MIDNERGISQYPLVSGDEVAGTVAAVGSWVPNLTVGDRIGLGRYVPDLHDVPAVRRR